MTTTASRVLIVSIIICIVIIGIWLSSGQKPLEVEVIDVSYGKVESIVTNTRAGTIKACRRARLAPIVGGQIEKLPVHEGSMVSANQVLLKMWNEDVKAKLVLAKQQALAAKAHAKESCVNADVASREAKRVIKLHNQKLASEGEMDHVRGQAEASRAGCKAAQDTAEVSVANVKVVEVALDRTILRAPFSGIVAEVNGEVGEFITPSPVGVPTLPAVDLIDNTCIYILAPIDEVDVPEIKTGMPVRITLDAFKNHPFPGTVRRIAPYVQDREKQARTVDIEVDFNNVVGQQNIIPGYSADVEVLLSIKDNTINIPTEAIFDSTYVFVVDLVNYTLEKREITLGIGNWVNTEITQGLEAGEYIIRSANIEGVKDGMLVSVKNSIEAVQ